ncbi:MAG TPA: hypothetical protein VEL31_25800 [Ktedonobacteraceae bacterium]|nr:hypothetical protein [Ktedonobacteraceae bacterium]
MSMEGDPDRQGLAWQMGIWDRISQTKPRHAWFTYPGSDDDR